MSRLKSLLARGSVRWGILLSLIAIEVVLLACLRIAVNPASHAFLIKKGNDYVVFWSQDGQYESVAHSDLRSAINFAKKELGLVKAESNRASEIESLWTQDRFGTFTVNWKTFRFAHLNHLTFQKESDAKYFETAFRSGAYTPSPFGHSVLFLPIRKP